MRRHLLLLLLLLPLLLPAQMSSFVDMQNEMMALMERQDPQLLQLQTKTKDLWKQVDGISGLLAYPKNIPLYRDSCLTALVMLRKRNDGLNAQLQELWLAWRTYNSQLMAVYTRYGELKAAGTIDDNLKAFLLKFRALDEKMAAIQKQLKDSYNEIDFLLNSKLN